MANPTFDLIEHFRLPADFRQPTGTDPHVTVHTFEVPDPDRRRRRTLVTQNWSRGDRLGRGSFGTVYLEKEDGGELRAVKSVVKSPNESDDQNNLRELLSIAIFSKDNTNFPAFHGWYEDADHIYICMEFFEFGDLEKCLTSENKPLPESDAAAVCFQIAEALEAIHKHSITHRDLKPNNVFVVRKAPHWWVKLGDFGIAKRVRGMNSSTNLHTPFLGAWVAPEVMNIINDPESSSCFYTSAVDIWALGFLAYWCQTLSLPFNTTTVLRLHRTQSIPEGIFERIDGSNGAVEFIKSCLIVQPEQRPSASQVLEHPWLKSIDSESLDESSEPSSPDSNDETKLPDATAIEKRDLSPDLQRKFTFEPQSPSHTNEKDTNPWNSATLVGSVTSVSPKSRTLSLAHRDSITDVVGEVESIAISDMSEPRDSDIRVALVTEDYNANPNVPIHEGDTIEVLEHQADRNVLCQVGGEEIILPRKLISAPHWRSWPGQTDFMGKFYRILPEEKSIEVLDQEGAINAILISKLEAFEIRYVAKWTSTPLDELRKLGAIDFFAAKGGHEEFLLPGAWRKTLPRYGTFDGIEDMMVDYGAKNSETFPIEWNSKHTLTQMRRAFEYAPEVQISKLQRDLLSPQEKESAHFGSHNVLYMTRLTLDAIYSGNIVRHLAVLSTKEMQYASAAFDNVLARINQGSREVSFDFNVPIKWGMHVLGRMTNYGLFDVGVRYVYYNHYGGDLKKELISNISNSSLKAIRNSHDQDEFREKYPFRQWNMKAVDAELAARKRRNQRNGSR